MSHKCHHHKKTHKPKSAYIYTCNNGISQNVNLCEANSGKLVTFNSTPIRKNIQFNGTDTVTICVTGDYKADFTVNAITDGSDGIISFGLLKNNLSILESIYSSITLPHTSGTITGHCKFTANKNDIIQLSSNNKIPVVINAFKSPFENKSVISGTITPGWSTNAVSPPIVIGSTSSIYVCITSNCVINSVSDGTNNFILAIQTNNIQIWYLDLPQANSTYSVTVNMSADILIQGEYRIRVYDFAGTATPSLGNTNIINGNTTTVLSTTVNSLGLAVFVSDLPIETSFPNFLLDTEDIAQILGPIGNHIMAVNNATYGASVVIKFAENQSVCKSPVFASLNIDLL